MKPAFVFLLAFAASASAYAETPIPPDATLLRELDCTLSLFGDFAQYKQAIFKDFTFKNPQAGWDEYASTLTLVGDKVVTARVDAANGTDPQENRDGAPTESSGWGGLSVYGLPAEFSATPMTAVVRSPANQRDLKLRRYDIAILPNVENLNDPPASTGKLECKLK
jgi:hypothetical protein